MAPDDARPVASSHGGRALSYMYNRTSSMGWVWKAKGRGKMTMGYREQGRRGLTRDRPEKKKEEGEGAKGAGPAARRACRSRKVRVSGSATTERSGELGSKLNGGDRTGDAHGCASP